jgi:hypothetical protein
MKTPNRDFSALSAKTEPKVELSPLEFGLKSKISGTPQNYGQDSPFEDDQLRTLKKDGYEDIQGTPEEFQYSQYYIDRIKVFYHRPKLGKI